MQSISLQTLSSISKVQETMSFLGFQTYGYDDCKLLQTATDLMYYSIESSRKCDSEFIEKWEFIITQIILLNGMYEDQIQKNIEIESLFDLASSKIDEDKLIIEALEIKCNNLEHEYLKCFESLKKKDIEKESKTSLLPKPVISSNTNENKFVASLCPIHMEIYIDDDHYLPLQISCDSDPVDIAYSLIKQHKLLAKNFAPLIDIINYTQQQVKYYEHKSDTSHFSFRDETINVNNQSLRSSRSIKNKDTIQNQYHDDLQTAPLYAISTTNTNDANQAAKFGTLHEDSIQENAFKKSDIIISRHSTLLEGRNHHETTISTKSVLQSQSSHVNLNSSQHKDCNMDYPFPVEVSSNSDENNKCNIPRNHSSSTVSTEAFTATLHLSEKNSLFMSAVDDWTGVFPDDSIQEDENYFSKDEKLIHDYKNTSSTSLNSNIYDNIIDSHYDTQSIDVIGKNNFRDSSLDMIIPAKASKGVIAQLDYETKGFSNNGECFVPHYKISELSPRFESQYNMHITRPASLSHISDVTAVETDSKKYFNALSVAKDQYSYEQIVEALSNDVIHTKVDTKDSTTLDEIVSVSSQATCSNKSKDYSSSSSKNGLNNVSIDPKKYNSNDDICNNIVYAVNESTQSERHSENSQQSTDTMATECIMDELTASNRIGSNCNFTNINQVSLSTYDVDMLLSSYATDDLRPRSHSQQQLYMKEIEKNQGTGRQLPASETYFDRSLLVEAINKSTYEDDICSYNYALCILDSATNLVNSVSKNVFVALPLYNEALSIFESLSHGIPDTVLHQLRDEVQHWRHVAALISKFSSTSFRNSQTIDATESATITFKSTELESPVTDNFKDVCTIDTIISINDNPINKSDVFDEEKGEDVEEDNDIEEYSNKFDDDDDDDDDDVLLKEDIDDYDDDVLLKEDRDDYDDDDDDDDVLLKEDRDDCDDDDDDDVLLKEDIDDDDDDDVLLKEDRDDYDDDDDVLLKEDRDDCDDDDDVLLKGGRDDYDDDDDDVLLKEDIDDCDDDDDDNDNDDEEPNKIINTSTIQFEDKSLNDISKVSLKVKSEEEVEAMDFLNTVTSMTKEKFAVLDETTQSQVLRLRKDLGLEQLSSASLELHNINSQTKIEKL